jgi:signal peptidase
MSLSQKQTLIKVTKIVLNVMFYAFLSILILFSIANMKLEKNDDIANIFGNGFLTVLTDSMDGDQENSFTTSDLVFVKLLNNETRLELKEGDIITYFSMSIPGLPNGTQGFITHRIKEVFTLDGEIFLITQGDKKVLVGTELVQVEDKPIHISEAIAVYQSKWVNAGETVRYLQTPQGFALFVILPVFIILVFEGVILIKNIMVINNQKLEQKYATDKVQKELDLEAEKEKIRQQILAEMQSEKEKK